MTTHDSYSITLTKDEILVLFDMLSDFREEKALPVRDQAERRALWNLTCLLEKTVTEAFSPKYKEKVEIARRHLSY